MGSNPAGVWWHKKMSHLNQPWFQTAEKLFVYLSTTWHASKTRLNHNLQKENFTPWLWTLFWWRCKRLWSENLLLQVVHRGLLVWGGADVESSTSLGFRRSPVPSLSSLIFEDSFWRLLSRSWVVCSKSWRPCLVTFWKANPKFEAKVIFYSNRLVNNQW